MDVFDGVEIIGAREHNLKNIDLKIPRNKLTVITGLSGSGKSSVAFDIVYAEGQRRYIESLSVHAQNFLMSPKKPDVTSIKGLSPSVAIEQKTISTNPRSTVGTVTEIYDYLRLLYARAGTPHCPIHNVPVLQQTPQKILKEIMSLPKGTKFFVLAPVVQSQKGEFLKEFNQWAGRGFTQARVDGEWIDLAQAKKLAKHKRHNIDLLMDRLIVDEKFKHRLAESINLSLGLADGLVTIELAEVPKTRTKKKATKKKKKTTSKKTTSAILIEGQQTYSIHHSCPECSYSYPELEPRVFSFNNPKGACEDCNGLGYLYDEEEERIDVAEDEFIEEQLICPSCDGTRLNERGRHVFIGDYTISDLSRFSAKHLLKILKTLKLSDKQELVGEKILKQIKERLEYMLRVGTSYLALERPINTLSGGEVQRIRLATQVGSALVGVLYVLDEPSIGLHPRDHHRLLEVIQDIKERGNTILLVEHDEETIRSADHIIDLGPGAGILGGEVVTKGTIQQIEKNTKSLTGRYLSGKEEIPIPSERRSGHGHFLKLNKASGNNLQNVDLKLPLGTLCAVTGVSGSGKSTLIIDTLYRALAEELRGFSYYPEAYGSLKGVEHLDKVVQINQKPIGRTPRSVPATYVGLLPMIRTLFAQLPTSQLRGYAAGDFSFNVKGGRCEDCQGAGVKKVEMNFLAHVRVVCDTCGGRRYNSDILSVRYRGKNISDILEMSVKEADEFFTHHKLIKRKLETLMKVGMDYMTLGQNSTTLSGGEAQRVKLSRELSKNNTGNTLYILDEPTTGLHFHDVKKLVELLHELVAKNNTVIVIEHHLDVVKSCDYVIDLGPEGGDEGGQLMACGTPEEVAGVKASLTGQFLKKVLS